MAPIAREIARMVDMLPEKDQNLAYELVKKPVLAWDPAFTKVTDDEAARIRTAEESGFVPADKISWDDLSKFTG